MSDTYVPVFGFAIEVEWKNPDDEAIVETRMKLSKWAGSYKPGGDFLIRARRKYTQAFVKMITLGFSANEIAGIIDYVTNSSHLDQFEKIANEKDIKNAYISIFGFKQQFIRDGNTISGGLIEKGKEIIKKILNSNKYKM